MSSQSGLRAGCAQLPLLSRLPTRIVPGAFPTWRAGVDDDESVETQHAPARPPQSSSASGASSSAPLHSFALLPVRRSSRPLLHAASSPHPHQPHHPLQQQQQQQHHHHHRHLASWSRFLPSAGGLRGAVEGPHRQVTNLLIALNVATYGVSLWDRGVVAAMALIPYLVAQGEWHRLLTAGFLHTGGLHLLSNCLALHWLGPDLESATGRGRFAAIYLASVLAGSLVQYQMGSFGTVSWGASGGVSGLFAAYVLYRLRNKSFTGWNPQDVWWVAQVVGINVLLSMFAGGSIAHWAHLGGALGGAAVCFLIGPRYRWRNGYVEDWPILPWFRRR